MLAFLRRSRLFVRTNELGARTSFQVGRVVELDGQLWRVTRHRLVNTVPWPTVRVYGHRVSG